MTKGLPGCVDTALLLGSCSRPAATGEPEVSEGHLFVRGPWLEVGVLVPCVVGAFLGAGEVEVGGLSLDAWLVAFCRRRGQGLVNRCQSNEA